MHIITGTQCRSFMADKNQRFGQALINSLPRQVYDEWNELNSRAMTDLFYEPDTFQAIDIAYTHFGNIFSFDWSR